MSKQVKRERRAITWRTLKKICSHAWPTTLTESLCCIGPKVDELDAPKCKKLSCPIWKRLPATALPEKMTKKQIASTVKKIKAVTGGK